MVDPKVRTLCGDMENSEFAISNTNVGKSVQVTPKVNRLSSEHANDLGDRDELKRVVINSSTVKPGYAPRCNNTEGPRFTRSNAERDNSELDSPKTNGVDSKRKKLRKSELNSRLDISSASDDGPKQKRDWIDSRSSM